MSRRQTPVQQEAHVSKLIRFINDESGATAIEYGLIAAGIAVAIIAAVNTLGGNLKDIFTTISAKLAGSS